MHTTTLGIDVAKTVFQLHGVDARGRAVLSHRVKRQQLLDTVANLPAGKPYVKTNKHDGRDAEAICAAVGRPTMRVVSIKTVEQTDLQAVHRTRSLFMTHRPTVINQIRGLLAEQGWVIAQSLEKIRPAVVRFLDDAASGLTA